MTSHIEFSLPWRRDYWLISGVEGDDVTLVTNRERDSIGSQNPNWDNPIAEAEQSDYDRLCPTPIHFGPTIDTTVGDRGRKRPSGLPFGFYSEFLTSTGDLHQKDKDRILKCLPMSLAVARLVYAGSMSALRFAIRLVPRLLKLCQRIFQYFSDTFIFHLRCFHPCCRLRAGSRPTAAIFPRRTLVT